MIFITVGTSKLQFNRLLKIIDELCDEGILNGNDILAQIGYSTYQPCNYKYVKFVDSEEHHMLIRDAEYVISHSGTGSVVTALKQGKKIIVFPRLMEYKEHLDNHQLEIADFFKNMKSILYATNKLELVKCIEEVSMFNPIEFISNNKKINQLIIDFIEN